MNIRKALALSIDKSKILTEALQLEGEIIDGPILPLDVPQSPKEKINFDLNQANQILDEAGWQQISPQDYSEFIKKLEEEKAAKAKEEADKAGNTPEQPTTTQNVTQETAEPEKIEDEIPQPFYRKKNDTILEVTLTTVNQPENTKAVKLIKEFWQNIGVKVNLQIVEGSKISREIIKPRNYQILLFGIIVGSNPDPYPFWHSSRAQDPGLNLAMFVNREADKLLEDNKKIVDQEKQIQNYQRFQEILTSEIPAIFLYNPTYTYAVDKKIKGINIDRIIIPADRFNDSEDWYIKTERKFQGAIDNGQ